MALSRLVIVVLQLAAFATRAAQISLPANVEIDVVFPRQGETYAPVSPFPVVFAIQNATVAWSFGFSFDWNIETERGSLVDTGIMVITSDAADPPVPPADPYLLINKSIELPLYPNNALTLAWQFNFFGNCTGYTDGGYTFQTVPFNAQGSFNFSTAYGGKAVDVLAEGQCPALGSIVPVQTSVAANCPQIGDSGIQPSPCAFTIDAAVASSVSAAVVPTTTAGVTAAASGDGTGTGTGSVPTQTTATGTSTTMSSSAGPTTAGSGSTSNNAGVRNAASQGLTAVMAGVVAVGAVVL